MADPFSNVQPAGSEPTWRIGVLFSRSGVTAVSETEHFLGTVLAIEQINAAGGVLGGGRWSRWPWTRSPTPTSTGAWPNTWCWKKA